MEAHWVLLVGGGLWFLVAGPIFVWRRFRRHLRADGTTQPSAATAEPSWWLQPMSRRQVTVLGLPLIASSIAGVVTDSEYVGFAWVFVVGGTLGAAYLVLAYLWFQRLERVRRFRPAEDGSPGKWRRYPVASRRADVALVESISGRHRAAAGVGWGVLGVHDFSATPQPPAAARVRAARGP